jgi:hypothetical protein
VAGAIKESSNATGINGNQANNSATFGGASYVYARSGGTWSQQAYLKASNTGSNDFFGQSVAVSGDTVVVGARGESSNATGVDGDQSDDSTNSSGAAYVFTRSGSTWSQQAYLKASNTGATDLFGQSVAISGDSIVVGAYLEDGNANDSGAAYVFTRSGSTWSQQAYLKASNPGSNDFFGGSVAISGNTIAVGAYGEAVQSGAAYVFTRSGGAWSQQNHLTASNAEGGDNFARSVATSDSTMVAGAIKESSNATGINGNQADNSATNSGAAYVFASAPAVPVAPFGIQAFPGNAQVNVMWMPPGDAGSSPITGYTVTTYESGNPVAGKT